MGGFNHKKEYMDRSKIKKELKDGLEGDCDAMPGCNKETDKKLEKSKIKNQFQLLGKLLMMKKAKKSWPDAFDDMWDWMRDEDIDKDNAQKILQYLWAVVYVKLKGHDFSDLEYDD